MGPKRTRKTTRALPYDPELLENWTLARLREELSKRGIVYKRSAKRMTLVKLLSEAQEDTSVRGARSQDASAVRHQDGDQNSNRLINMVSSLSDSVATLQEMYIRLENRINENTTCLSRPCNDRQAAAAAGSEHQRATEAVIARSFGASVSGSTSSAEFNLDTAYQRFQSEPVDLVSSTGVSSAKRTRFGYASESLPLVETVSPALRHSIVTDEALPEVGSSCRRSASAMPPHVIPHDELTQEVNNLWKSALSAKTLSVYKSALNCFITFILMLGISFPKDSLPFVDEDLLILFVTHCQKSLHLRYDTIKLYLSGIRFHYIRNNLGDPLANTLRLLYILRAIKKSQVNSGVKRLPITYKVLVQMCDAISCNSGLFDSFTSLMLLCAYKTAFYGFLRCGEFTCQALTDSNFIRICDVFVYPDMSCFNLTLRVSKMDPFRKGITIKVFENNLLSPVFTMHDFLKVRRSQGSTPESPLFVDNITYSKPLLRQTFMQLLNETLTCIGLNDGAYSGHSFRIGAATSAAVAGVEDHVIQILGRWSSDCFKRYIRTDPCTISSAQRCMSA